MYVCVCTCHAISSHLLQHIQKKKYQEVYNEEDEHTSSYVQQLMNHDANGSSEAGQHTRLEYETPANVEANSQSNIDYCHDQKFEKPYLRDEKDIN